MSDDAKRHADKAYAKFLRDLADVVENGNYVTFEYSTRAVYPNLEVARYTHNLVPIDMQMSFSLVVRNG